jgi:transcriptional regulator with XRE-family HTH domain
MRKRKERTPQEKSRLARYLEEAYGRSGYPSKRALSLKAGLSANALSTFIAQTARPEPETLRKLAPVLDVPEELLLRLAGYLSDEPESPPSASPEMEAILAQVKTLPRDHQRVFWQHARDLLRLIERLPEDGLDSL